MTKPPTGRNPAFDSPIFEVSAGDARQALRHGDVAVLQAYLEEFEANLRAVGGLLAAEDERQQRLVFDPSSHPTVNPVPPDGDTIPHAEEDWEGSTRQLRAAIALGQAEPIGWYLIGSADFVHELRRVLNPDGAERSEWQLQFHRRRRGRPKDAGTTERYGKIRMRMWRAERQFGKREAAIAHVCAELRESRSTVIRALTSTKKQRRASLKKPE